MKCKNCLSKEITKKGLWCKKYKIPIKNENKKCVGGI